MSRITKILSVAVLAAAVLPQATFAAPPSRSVQAERRGLDLLPSRQALRLSRAAKTAVAPGMAGATVAVADVGDVDSFGRTLKWLGVTQAAITLDSSCDPASTDPCQVIAPAGPTSFAFTDAARISLPGKATNSLLCYWFSPLINVTYSNPGTTSAVSMLRYTPTLTVENPVLADPALIDPTTGVAFGGRLTTSMSSSEMFQVPLPPGTTISERSRDSAVCIAGFLSRRTLTDTFGLTSAQVDEFFKKPTTVRLNVSGQVRGVSFASLIFGLRIIGD
ncbi:hypothetical protein [Lysobacter xanthus]